MSAGAHGSSAALEAAHMTPYLWFLFMLLSTAMTLEEIQEQLGQPEAGGGR